MGSVATRRGGFWWGDTVSQNRPVLFRGRHFEDVIIILCVSSGDTISEPMMPIIPAAHLRSSGQ